MKRWKKTDTHTDKHTHTQTDKTHTHARTRAHAALKSVCCLPFQVVDAGRTVVFNCSVRGGLSPGPASVGFLKDGEPVVQGGRLSVHTTQVSTRGTRQAGQPPRRSPPPFSR